MAEVRILSPCGVIGSGFPESSFGRGLSLRPHVIACDGGSTDMGPASLGTGVPHFSRAATKRDLRLMLLGREQLGVPLIVGSCGHSRMSFAPGFNQRSEVRGNSPSLSRARARERSLRFVFLSRPPYSRSWSR